jgi:hypothetical protein
MAIIYDYAYPIITTKESLIQFVKRKRKFTVVKFDGSLLPINCSVCGKPITNDDNLIKVFPKHKRIIPMHYECAWSSLLTEIYSIRIIQ